MNRRNHLIVSPKTFGDMVLQLVMSGVTFTAVEEGDFIKVTFTGGY